MRSEAGRPGTCAEMMRVEGKKDAFGVTQMNHVRVCSPPKRKTNSAHSSSVCSVSGWLEILWVEKALPFSKCWIRTRTNWKKCPSNS